jgi:hypothetical protein
MRSRLGKTPSKVSNRWGSAISRTEFLPGSMDRILVIEID